MSDVKRRNLISLKTAGERGLFKRTKCYELINAGKIIAYKRGHTTLIDADSLDAYLASLPQYEPKLIEPKPKSTRTVAA